MDVKDIEKQLFVEDEKKTCLEGNKSLDDLWSKFLQMIRANVTEPIFKTWFEPIEPIKFEDNTLRVGVPSPFFYEYFEEKCSDLLGKALHEVFGKETKLMYYVKADPKLLGRTLGIVSPPPPMNAEYMVEVKHTDENSIFAPIYTVDKYRLWSDGKGITTLVVFHECSCRCKYCLNKATWHGYIRRRMTPEMLHSEVKSNNLYYLTTGGGITFGGGEPCLHSDFIVRFSEICNPKWKLNLETSLNIPQSHVEKLLPVIDYYIIDIKDMNPMIYERYTGIDNKQVIDNLKYLLANGKADQMLVRVPWIPNFNTEEDIEKSVRTLKEMGIKNIERFNYKISSLFTPDESGRLMGMPAEKSILKEE